MSERSKGVAGGSNTMPILKVLQKQLYDVVSNRILVIVLLFSFILITLSVIRFGETVVQWSHDQYEAVFNSFSDNLAGRSFQSKLCDPVPIDVVYTWVNGSDPWLMEQMAAYTQPHSPTNHRNSSCYLTNCVLSHMLVITPSLPSSYDIDSIQTVLRPPSCDNIISLHHIPSYMQQHQHNHTGNDTEYGRSNITVLRFSTVKHANDCLSDVVRVGVGGSDVLSIDGSNHSILPSYLSSEHTEHTVTLHDTIIITGIKSSVTNREIVKALPHSADKHVTQVVSYTENSVAAISFDTVNITRNVLQDKSVVGSNVTVTAAHLLYNLSAAAAGSVGKRSDWAESRFGDHDELRYSLRSLEMFAPWVRHVWVVTNGQIPHWINLDNPRLTLVTHEEIFTNQSHLPTFSSPAIESNLHLIPGLSRHFIYMNDDVFLGRPLSPHDLYTHAGGHKVYLSWPIPSCTDACPSNWINDNFCDRACNISECDWDGGDCDGRDPDSAGAGAAGGDDFWGHFGGDSPAGGSSAGLAYCAPGCAQSWLADRFCDTVCNQAGCGFDAGDCGKDGLTSLYRVNVTSPVGGSGQYVIPRHTAAFIINLQGVLGYSGRILTGHYSDTQDTPLLHVSAIDSDKWLVAVLKPNSNSNSNQTLTRFTIDVSGVNNRDVAVNVTLQFSVDSSEDKVVAPGGELTSGQAERTHSNGNVSDSDQQAELADMNADLDRISDWEVFPKVRSNNLPAAAVVSRNVTSSRQYGNVSLDKALHSLVSQGK